MKKSIIAIAILGFVAVVSFCLNKVADFSGNISRYSSNRITKQPRCDNSELKPEAFYTLAQTSPRKSEALENLKIAELCFMKEGDKAGVEKVRNQMAYINTIDFEQNRLITISALRTLAQDNLQEGKIEEAAKIEAQVRELEQAKD